MSDPSGRLIPNGVTASVKIVIVDGLAVFQWNPLYVARRFFLVEKEGAKDRGVVCDTIYEPRTQKCLTKYDGLGKESIRDKILGQLKALNANVKQQ